MVKYRGKDGQEYILRFDMSAIEAMTEVFSGDYAKTIESLNAKEIETVVKVFEILATAGAEYVAERDGKPMPEKVKADGLISKHTSFGKVKAILLAIEEAIKDGNRTQAAEEDDDRIRDGYLDEYRQLEREKN